jgi:hypothetical protein
VDVRIGVTYSAKEIDIELGDDADRAELRSRIDDALANAEGILWLTDRRGRDVGIPSEKIAYIEIGSSDMERRIGFGS